jgi:hypothetical protein
MEKIMKHFELVGIDGNAFNVMGYVKRAMKETGYSYDEISAYQQKCMSNDYDHLLSESIGIIENCNRRLDEQKEAELLAKKKTVSKIRTQEEIDAYIDEWFDKLIPECGKADTVAGEILRAMCRINYRWYNDGDYAGYGYGIETAGSACTYLIGFSDLEWYVETLLNITPDHDDAYEKALIELCSAIIDYLESHKDLFDEANNDDYQNCFEWFGDSAEEEERRHWGDTDWGENYAEDDYEEDGYWDEDDE